MVVLSVCIECKHLYDSKNGSEFICPAYPIGIPNEIFFDASGTLCLKENADKIHFQAIKQLSDK